MINFNAFRHVLLPVTVLFCLCVSGDIDAQSINTQKLNAFFDHLDANNQGMGSVSVFQNGEEVYHRSIGYADVSNNIAATPETAYRIGSISKTFTATLIMQLVDEGSITLDTPLSEFYPDIPNSEGITVEHLLRHRSGLYNFTSSEDYLTFNESSMSEEALIELFIKNGTIFKPGEKMHYSNTNYVLLSFIIEAVEEMTFDAVLAKKIAEPCGLSRTYYGGPIGSMPDEAFSYSSEENWALSTETDMSIPRGAGAIVSTPSDINKFLICLFTGELISDSSLEKMKTMVEGYGLGMFTMPFGERQSFGHTGGIDEFQSMTGYFPSDEIAVTYLGNGVKYKVNSIMIGVLSCVYDQPFEMPQFIEVATTVLDSYEGTYASPNLPIKLKIYRDGSSLYGQGTGQPAFQLEAVDESIFKYDQAGLSITFKPNENKLLLSQGGGEYEMTKEE